MHPPANRVVRNTMHSYNHFSTGWNGFIDSLTALKSEFHMTASVTGVLNSHGCSVYCSIFDVDSVILRYYSCGVRHRDFNYFKNQLERCSVIMIQDVVCVKS